MSLKGSAVAQELLKGKVNGADVIYMDTYKIAVMNGYTGTIDEWLASLKGEKGDKGDKGDTGEPGTSLIDDTTVGDGAWSSEKIVQTFGVPFNASENCVQILPIVGSKVKVRVVKPETATHIKLYCVGKNLVTQDSSWYTKNYAIRQDNGNLISSSTSAYSDYVLVSHLVGKTIYINGAFVGGTNPGYAFYDADKNNLKGYGGNKATATVPDGAMYFRFTIKLENIYDANGKPDYNRVQVEIGNALTEVESYKEIEFEPVDGNIELDCALLDGVNTIYAYAGTMVDGVFTPTEPVKVSVDGYENPVATIERLTNAIVSIGSNI